MKQEHTQGKWEIQKRDGHANGVRPVITSRLLEAGGRIAIVSYHGVPTYTEADANAMRIVDCVNACDGIDDPRQLAEQKKALLDVVGPLLEAYYNMAQMLNPECQFGGDQLTQQAEVAIAAATN